MKAQRCSTGTAVLFNVGARCVWVGKSTSRPLYPWERDPVPIVEEDCHKIRYRKIFYFMNACLLPELLTKVRPPRLVWLATAVI
jgi:hypothetical protein